MKVSYQRTFTANVQYEKKLKEEHILNVKKSIIILNYIVLFDTVESPVESGRG